jgi:hypothetical protein
MKWSFLTPLNLVLAHTGGLMALLLTFASRNDPG